MGSNHYTNEAIVGLGNIDWMITLDMVGRLRDMLRYTAMALLLCGMTLESAMPRECRL